MNAKAAKVAKVANEGVDTYSDAQCAALAVVILGSSEGVIPSRRINDVLRRWQRDDARYLIAYAGMSDTATELLREHGSM